MLLMKRMKYFFECCFNQSEGFEDLDRVINEFKDEHEEIQLQLVKELYHIIQTKNYTLADSILVTYGGRQFDDLLKVEKFIKFLYDKLIDKPTEVKSEDFIKKFKGVFCPACSPKPKHAIFLNLIEKATVIANGLQIYICKPCRLVWLNEDIHADNAQDYKKFMSSLGLKGLWKELKNIDYL